MKSSLLVVLAFVALGARASTIKQIMPSAKVDLKKDTATLPLHLGYMKDGRKVWFVITDTNDAATAQRMGLVHAGQISAVLNAKSTRTAHVDSNGIFTFDAGTVDFSPKQMLVPGNAPNLFPPKTAMPGSIGDANYSSFVRIAGTNTVLNAPIVAFNVEATQISFCDGGVNYDLVHDRVAEICPKTMEVSIRLGHGFAGGSPVIYMSFDSNNPLPATMEASTYAPAENDLTTTGASETLFGFVNGPTGANNPQRQGFDSALAGEGPPLNILDGLNPSSTGYTPLWDVNATVWTEQAIAKGQRVRVTSGNDAVKAAEMGELTNPAGGMVGTLGLLVNCPVIGFPQ